MGFKLKSSSIQTEGKKSIEQLCTIDNIIDFNKLLEEVIKFCNE